MPSRDEREVRGEEVEEEHPQEEVEEEDAEDDEEGDEEDVAAEAAGGGAAAPAMPAAAAPVAGPVHGVGLPPAPPGIGGAGGAVVGHVPMPVAGPPLGAAGGAGGALAVAAGAVDVLGAGAEGRISALLDRKKSMRQAARDAQRQITNSNKRRKRLAQKMSGSPLIAVVSVACGHWELIAPWPAYNCGVSEHYCRHGAGPLGSLVPLWRCIFSWSCTSHRLQRSRNLRDARAPGPR